MKRLRATEGQSIVEFALMLPLLLVLLFGVVDFGLIFWRQIQITDAARVLARQAAVYRFNGFGSPCEQMRTQPADVLAATNGLPVDFPPDCVDTGFDTSNPPSKTVVVTVSYTQQVFGPLPFIGPSIVLSSTATERPE